MPRCIFQHMYSSSYGAGQPGDVIDVTEAEAAAFNRDSPGVLIPEPAPEPEPDDSNASDDEDDDADEVDGENEDEDGDADQRSLDAPPSHRQVTGGKKRGRRRTPTNTEPPT